MQAVERLEKLVMARVHGEVTGDNKLAGNLNTSIKYMFGGIIVNTATNQKMIKTAIAAFKNCKVKMWNSYTKAVLLQKKYWKLSQIYPKCMVTEDKLKLAKIVSARSVDHLKETIKQLKALLKAQGRTCGNVCANRGHESYHEQLHRLARFYGKCKKRLVPTSEKLKSVEKRYKEKIEGLAHKRYIAMRDKCKLIAYLMNRAKCDAVTHMAESCTGYQACWRVAIKNYDTIVVKVKEEEKDMKIQWRALKRIQCYLNVLDEKDQAKKQRSVEGLYRDEKTLNKTFGY